MSFTQGLIKLRTTTLNQDGQAVLVHVVNLVVLRRQEERLGVGGNAGVPYTLEHYWCLTLAFAPLSMASSKSDDGNFACIAWMSSSGPVAFLSSSSKVSRYL